jgi:hypothetical protein
MRRGVGDGSRAVPRGGEACEGGGGVGAAWRSGGVWPTSKQGRGDADERARHSNGRRWFEYNSNSNYFNTFQTMTDRKQHSIA